MPEMVLAEVRAEAWSSMIVPGTRILKGPASHSCQVVVGEAGGEGMLIAVSSSGTELSSPVDPRFGRCAYFVLYDDTTQQGSVFANGSKEAVHGAGLQAAQRLIDKGVKIVLSGRVGPKAQQVLDRAGIRTQTGITGTIEQALEIACQNYSSDLPPLTMTT